ncbi:MAG: diadenylate cyclase CdaA [Alphaproteobacteria bacterium]|nr:diadenylate cyclase CdaA [Alphaproteobacteria bacterium]
MSHLSEFIQLAIIVALVWFFYKKLIRNTASEKLVRGIFGLVLLWMTSFVCSALHIDLLGGFFHWTALFLSISLIVVFQPELRKFLALMGSVSGWRKMFYGKTDNLHKRDTSSLGAIVSAVEYMSSKHTGALIVFPSMLDESVIERKGVRVDGQITSELLLTIFFNKTPLHDGAVIIENNRIAYAGAILPLSQNNLNWKYGTRHRAALGLSEASSATVLVVSEESGDISIAEKGKITKYDDLKKLRTKLEKVMNL